MLLARPCSSNRILTRRTASFTGAHWEASSQQLTISKFFVHHRHASPFASPSCNRFIASCIAESNKNAALCETLCRPHPKLSKVVQALWCHLVQRYASLTPSAHQVVEKVILSGNYSDKQRHPLDSKADCSSSSPKCSGGRSSALLSAKQAVPLEIFHDHFAFRTFGVPGLGIASVAAVMNELGYEQQGDFFEFPGKKLQATWYAPKDKELYEEGAPRIFVSELQVHKLSREAQLIIHRCVSTIPDGGSLGSSCAQQLYSHHQQQQQRRSLFEQASLSANSSSSAPSSAAASPSTPRAAVPATAPSVFFPPTQVLAAMMTGSLPWEVPSWEDYRLLQGESEYAAWVLAHGYALNHTAISVHRLCDAEAVMDTAASSEGGGDVISAFTEAVRAAGMPLNLEGGLIKVSPDGLLLQSSTLSDQVPFTFRNGEVQSIPGSYIEFVERKATATPHLIINNSSSLSSNVVAVKELSRRDGFEAGNADKIFASTTSSRS
ncbi:hypothetical protein CEUSTIGMA_g6494.t1 [Chlamydomonas eustigma]|uniref:2-oxoadipate dioxygenase/decarboxylase n=1 Tax=Chlamydomonas eustigma TaxID=1157962 RepID=A0A250X7J0_9CHLO|nr:hypothetical protein CEUSTIGMA_g6494.t1 [Chlamydomonas eustigma]|eukprot:GAX79054.1 hypothetical protein CEUSTIGMA_g6494.t1 [Chlamydomonas eustigma]